MIEQTGAHAAFHYYAIRVQGHLDDHWSAWFEGMTLRHSENDTVIEGFLGDQSALQGLLAKLMSLNLVLISVQRLERTHDAVSKLSDHEI